jgi:hypothetical protein
VRLGTRVSQRRAPAVESMRNLLNNQANDSRRQPNRRSNKKPTLPTYKRGPISWLVIAVILFMAMMMLQQGLVTNTIRWDKFISYLYEGQVDRIGIGETEISGKFKEHSQAAADNGKSPNFKVNYRPESGAKEQLNETLSALRKMEVDDPKYHVDIDYTPPRIWMMWLLAGC